MLLEELFQAKDFAGAAAGLAGAFREKHKLPGVHQLGLVVPEAEAAALLLEAKGLGPFFIASGAPVIWRERGEDRKFKGKLGMAFYQGFELELLEPGEGSDHYRGSLDPEGRIVVQHVSLLVDDVDQWAAKMNSAGYPTRIRGLLKSGPLRIDFAYMETEADAGIIVEFISMKLLGRTMKSGPGLIHSLGRIQKWTGKRSWSL